MPITQGKLSVVNWPLREKVKLFLIIFSRSGHCKGKKYYFWTSYEKHIMTKGKSKFVVLEGLDGTGKSTQIKLLQKYLDKTSVPNYFVHFPRTDHESPVFGTMVARFLRGDYGPLELVHPELVALIYAGDRFNASESLKKKLKSGFHVIADRYVFSNVGFQCAKLQDNEERKELMQKIFHMEYDYFKIPRPDLSVFLHVPIEFVQQQLHAQRDGDERNYLQGKADIHEKSMDFQKAVEEVYLEACQMMPDHLFYLSCMNEQGLMMTPDEIHLQLLKLLSERELI